MAAHRFLREAAETFIAAANAFDIEAALHLFTFEAVIDDSSTGHRFEGHAGIRYYLERFFIGYRTVTRLLSIKRLDERRALVRVDFTGDFGHEIGLLEFSLDTNGLVARIDADLE
ncbi:MAG: nuclear transport factor 2 family protein [Stenotrophomonas maltophilia]